jgi:hypothetical protein
MACCGGWSIFPVRLFLSPTCQRLEQQAAFSTSMTHCGPMLSGNLSMTWKRRWTEDAEEAARQQAGANNI